MKTLSIICLALIATVTAWAQDAVGNSQVNVDFSKFKSFTWAQSDVTAVGPDGYNIYYYEFDAAPKNQKGHKDQKKAKNKSAKAVREQYAYSYTVIIPAKDESVNAIIRDAISNELEGRGYAEAAASGDLIVSYHVLENRATIHGYNNDDPIEAGGKQVRTPSDTATFSLEPGTLMVSLIDAKTSQMVWNGFTRNMNVNDAFVTDEVKLKQAVHNIFQQFNYSADKAQKN